MVGVGMDIIQSSHSSFPVKYTETVYSRITAQSWSQEVILLSALSINTRDVHKELLSREEGYIGIVSSTRTVYIIQYIKTVYSYSIHIYPAYTVLPPLLSSDGASSIWSPPPLV